MTLLTQIQLRRDTVANWVSANPVLALGEIGIETDTGHVRVGDGASAWTSLATAFKQVNPRTLLQLGTTPTSADIALGAGAMFVGPDNILRFVNAAGTAFIAIDIVAMQAATTAAALAASNAQATATAAIPATQKGAASGVASLGSDGKVVQAQLTNKIALSDLTDGATQAALIASKQSIPLNWNGTTPALVSSTNPVPSFGSNAFIYTGAGGAVLDGQTYQTGDVAVWNGTVFAKEVFGGGYLGTAASPSALQTAFPAATYPACVALISGVLYFSNGTAWVKSVTASTDLSDGATLNTQITTNTAAAVQITGNVTITTGNQATYNGKILEWTGVYSVTINAGLANDFGFVGIPPASGNASIVSDGTTLFNGATTSQTRSAAGQSMFSVTQRASSRNSYVVV
jgi:hypothetical protein